MGITRPIGKAVEGYRSPRVREVRKRQTFRQVVECASPGVNGAFNEAVGICDANKDGKITEVEAKIYAEQAK